MSQRPPAIAFEDVPLDEARRISRGSRMDPALYHALKDKLQSLDNTATRMSLPEGTNPSTMRIRIFRIAAALGMPVTIRRVPGGLLFWRSTDEDLQQAKEGTEHLQVAARPAHAARRVKRRPWPRGTAHTASIRARMHDYRTRG